MNNTNTKFSVLHRREQIEDLKAEKFDLIVIGGGATGAGILLDAASRGLKTVLIEKRDFASGTSSKSTKLIHGGLRYLKQFEIGLVRESGTERAIVHHLAPHLVLPEKMLMPLIKGGTFGKWDSSFGIMVYDFLAGVEKEDRREMLNKEETIKLEPLLNEEILRGGAFYAEYRTDDARLTIELIKKAVSFGAIALNYCEATSFVYKENKICGIECKDKTGKNFFVISAKKIVSAAGPWVDKLRKIDKSLEGKRLHLTKGVHIVFPHEKFPVKHSLYFDAHDDRMIFAIPRGKITYVGTTDTNYKGDLNRVLATKKDAEYLIETLKEIFPDVRLSLKDIISSYAGLRPLIHEDGKSPSELSRKDEIFISPNGLISIAGGKLTGYRKMAERIVDLVTDQLEDKEDIDYRDCFTDEIYLTPNPIEDADAVEAFIKKTAKKIVKAGGKKYHAWYLVTNYGNQAKDILAKMEDFKSDSFVVALARAEAWFAVHHEMVNHAQDFFVRRTGRLYFDIKSIPIIREAVMMDFKKYFSWTAARLKKENKELDELIADATHFYEKEFV